MALIKCGECSNRISTRALSCPHCGAVLPAHQIKQSTRGSVCGVVCLVILLAFIGCLVFGGIKTRQEMVRRNELAAQEKKLFVDNIERHYAELTKFVEEKAIDASFIKLKVFEKHGQMNYKDVHRIYVNLRHKELLSKLGDTGPNDAKTRHNIYQELVALFPENTSYRNMLDKYAGTVAENERREATEEQKRRVKSESIATNSHEVVITRAEYGDAWPFTVESGILSGIPRDSLTVITFTVNGKTYAVNGTAKGTRRYADIEGIWARDPTFTNGEIRKNIGVVIARGLKLARGINEPYVPPKAFRPPIVSVGSPVRCDLFEIAATLDPIQTGAIRSIRISIKTDLPEFTNLMVGIDRIYYESGDTEKYPLDYFEEKATVGQWKSERVIELDHEKWRVKLNDRQVLLRKLGKDIVVTRRDDFIRVSFVVPVNQSDHRFGVRNANLTGKAVQESGGLRIVRREVKLSWPVAVN